MKNSASSDPPSSLIKWNKKLQILAGLLRLFWICGDLRKTLKASWLLWFLFVENFKKGPQKTPSWLKCMKESHRLCTLAAIVGADSHVFIGEWWRDTRPTVWKQLATSPANGLIRDQIRRKVVRCCASLSADGHIDNYTTNNMTSGMSSRWERQHRPTSLIWGMRKQPYTLLSMTFLWS